MNPINYFEKKFEQFKDQEAIIWNEKGVTYSWLLKKINDVKIKLDDQITNGSIVMIEGDFNPLCISYVFALIKKECIIVPVYKTTKNGKEDKIKITQPEFLISIIDNDVIFEKLSTRNNVNEIFTKLIRNKHPGLILFSSGSSGMPKAAVHDFLLLLEKFTNQRTSLKTLNFLLFDHWGGLNTMFHTLANGGTLITIKDRSPENVCNLIEKFHIELLPTSPTFLNLMILSESYKKYNLSSLKIITYGTEPMSANTLKKVNEIFPDVKIQQTYGLIEVGVLRSKSEKNDSLWVKLEGDEFKTRVIDGILQIKSKSTMLGYLNAKTPFTNDGWFVTGDTVEVKGKYFRIIGRESEIINVGGEKVYPSEIENVIQEIDDVEEVIVYGEKHQIVGNIVCAKIKLKSIQNNNQFIKKLKDFCKKRLEKYKIPIKITIVYDDLHSYRYKKIRKFS